MIKPTFRIHKRIIALAIAVILFSSIVFLGVEANHDCIDGGCQICCQIRSFLHFLSSTALLGALAAFSAAIVLFRKRFFTLLGVNAFPQTLVSHKVKLSN